MQKEVINEKMVVEKWAILLLGFFTLSSALATLAVLWLNL
jgi:hypothetical protein